MPRICPGFCAFGGCEGMRGDSVKLSPTIFTPSGPPFSPIVGDRGMICHVCRLIHTHTHCDGYLYGSGRGSNLSPVSPTVCCGVLLMAVLILGDAEGIAQFAGFIPHYPPPSPTRGARSTGCCPAGGAVSSCRIAPAMSVSSAHLHAICANLHEIRQNDAY